MGSFDEKNTAEKILCHCLFKVHLWGMIVCLKVQLHEIFHLRFFMLRNRLVHDKCKKVFSNINSFLPSLLFYVEVHSAHCRIHRTHFCPIRVNSEYISYLS